MSGSLPVGGVDLAAPSGTVASDADLVVRGLRKTYQSPPVRALRGVDLTVRRGEFVALMGPSGSGKSTLLHLIAGLDSPDEGTVAIAGVRTEELSAARLARLRRRHVGLVFQFFHLIEHMCALENVALAALVAGAKPTDATERARTLLDTLGLLDSPRAICPAPCPAGSASASRSPGRWPTARRCCSPTSRPARSTATAQAEVLELFSRLHQAGRTHPDGDPQPRGRRGRAARRPDARRPDPRLRRRPMSPHE